MITGLTLLVATLAALALPGGLVLYTLWIKSKRAKKERELLLKLSRRHKIPVEKLQRLQSMYMREKYGQKGQEKDEE
jgi:hypothetical protein